MGATVAKAPEPIAGVGDAQDIVADGDGGDPPLRELVWPDEAVPFELAFGQCRLGT